LQLPHIGENSFIQNQSWGVEVLRARWEVLKDAERQEWKSDTSTCQGAKPHFRSGGKERRDCSNSSTAHCGCYVQSHRPGRHMSLVVSSKFDDSIASQVFPNSQGIVVRSAAAGHPTQIPPSLDNQISRHQPTEPVVRRIASDD
jgi:hypothetical protein